MLALRPAVLPASIQDTRLANIDLSFRSESSQGKDLAIAGVAAAAAGVYLGKWWLIAAGLVAGAFGYQRYVRAISTRDRLQSQVQQADTVVGGVVG